MHFFEWKRFDKTKLCLFNILALYCDAYSSLIKKNYICVNYFIYYIIRSFLVFFCRALWDPCSHLEKILTSIIFSQQTTKRHANTMPNRFYDFIDRQGISFAVLNKQGGNGRGMILYSKDLIAVRAEGNAWRLCGARKTQPQPALQLPVNDYFGQYSFEILSGIQSQNKNKNFYV